MFNKGAGNQALVQYPDVASAQAAYEQVGVGFPGVDLLSFICV